MKNYQDINEKIYQIERGISKKEFALMDISEIMPAAIMLHSTLDGIPHQIDYMNSWGCQRLGVELEELNTLQEQYYHQYFVKDDLQAIYPKILDFCKSQTHTEQLNFFQRVKLYGTTSPSWFYTICKLLESKDQQQSMLLFSCPMDGLDNVMGNVKKILDENEYISKNYRLFTILTKREKEVIGLLGIGQSTSEIAETLIISSQTVATHRKNINRKLEIKSFAELIRFAIAFDLMPSCK